MHEGDLRIACLADEQALTARDQLAELRFRRRGGRLGAVRDGFAGLMGARSSYTLTVQTNLAMAHHYAGDSDGAQHELADALARARGFLRDADPQLQQIRYALADCLIDAGRAVEAAPLLAGPGAHGAEHRPTAAGLGGAPGLPARGCERWSGTATIRW